MSMAAWVACGAAVAWVACAYGGGSEAFSRIAGRRLRSSTGADHEVAADDDALMPEPTMILELMMVALRGGASIPHALRVVGASVGGPFGKAASGVGDSLLAGNEWESAWRQALAGPAGVALASVEEALEPSWRHGSSPLPRMEAAVNALGRESHDRMEREAAKLQTSVLMPVGLCFLPAFIVVGVMPVVAGWAASSW